MNAIVVLADLETARAAAGRALARATTLDAVAGPADTAVHGLAEAIGAELLAIGHLLDRAMNELREG